MDSATLQELRNQKLCKERKLSRALDNQRAHGFRMIGLGADVDEAKANYEAGLRRGNEIEDEVSCLQGEVESLRIQIDEHEAVS